MTALLEYILIIGCNILYITLLCCFRDSIMLQIKLAYVYNRWGPPIHNNIVLGIGIGFKLCVSALPTMHVNCYLSCCMTAYIKSYKFQLVVGLFHSSILLTDHLPIVSCTSNI